MLFHVNRLATADDSHEISGLINFKMKIKILQTMSSAVVGKALSL